QQGQLAGGDHEEGDGERQPRPLVGEETDGEQDQDPTGGQVDEVEDEVDARQARQVAHILRGHWGRRHRRKTRPTPETLRLSARRNAVEETRVPGTVVVGTQWGDEGKGKLTDLLAKEMAMVVR